jgi:hypothetical protein
LSKIEFERLISRAAADANAFVSRPIKYGPAQGRFRLTRVHGPREQRACSLFERVLTVLTNSVVANSVFLS